MCVCACVCVYVCVCRAGICQYMYVHVYVCVHVHVYVYLCVCICVYVGLVSVHILAFEEIRSSAATSYSTLAVSEICSLFCTPIHSLCTLYAYIHSHTLARTLTHAGTRTLDLFLALSFCRSRSPSSCLLSRFLSLSLSLSLPASHVQTAFLEVSCCSPAISSSSNM